MNLSWVLSGTTQANSRASVFQFQNCVTPFQDLLIPFQILIILFHFFQAVFLVSMIFVKFNWGH